MSLKSLLAEGDAMVEIQDLVDKIEELGDELKAQFREHFPSAYKRLDAYGAFELTHSRNPYDITIQSEMESLEEEY